MNTSIAPKFANVDRYTGRQVGRLYATAAEASNARRGFRCVTMLAHRKGFVELL